MLINMYYYIATIICISFVIVDSTDKPCAPRVIPDRSVVCVCNSTYCDTLTRVVPQNGHYVTYTSISSGLRFKKSQGQLTDCREIECPPTTLEIDPSIRYQSIEGFGGAVTDSAGINWKNLSAPLQKLLIDSYFGAEGIEYNMLRVPIGGSDFSTHPYAYNELPIDDVTLKNFTLSDEDYNYKIPMIKAAMKAAETPIHVVASTWSPPVWMKTNNKFYGASELKPKYFQTFADYHYKFIDQYSIKGIPIWGITTTNEPTNGVAGVIRLNSLGWTSSSMGNWIVNNLGPTIRNSTYKNVKIIISDDQRITLPYWVTAMILENPEVLSYIDGVGVHYYTDFIIPTVVITDTMSRIPDKFIISTEACEGTFPWEQHRVELGSWQRAYSYINSIITSLNHNFIGWIDWNLCLNEQGGPNWVGNYVDSPVIVFPETGEFYKQPMFYAMGHFSKFIPRGSQRIHVEMEKSFFRNNIEHVAFVTPRNSIVVVLYNSGNSQTINLKILDSIAFIDSPTNSVVTVELPYDDQE